MANVDRTTTTRALEDAWTSLLAITAELDEEDWSTPTACPGWTVADVVAHVIGTEHMLAGEQVPDVEIGEVPHVRNAIGEFNERWIVSLRGTPPAELWEELESVVGSRLALLGAMEDHEWDAEAWTPAGPDTYGRFMRIRVFDTWMHEQDIRHATGRPETCTGAAFEASLDEIASVMPYVVGKLGGAPDGTRLELRLEGPSPRTIAIVVDGRARLVEDFDGAEPTVTIQLSVADFRRLIGSRVDPSEAKVTVTGDVAVGEEIVANLGYVI
ncbi:MAG: maleylpyruvate isomerase family mycothiol-dependent enzyme [Acidimicrobiales bacterium]